MTSSLITVNIHVLGKTSWFEEFKRLAYHTPLIETEVLNHHSHQVLHVSFSHNGKMFATCSKDGYILVCSFYLSFIKLIYTRRIIITFIFFLLSIY